MLNIVGPPAELGAYQRGQLLPNLVSGLSSCGSLLLVFWLDAVDEWGALNDIGELPNTCASRPATGAGWRFGFSKDKGFLFLLRQDP